VRQLVSGEKRFAQLCREHDLCQTLLRRWKEQYEAQGENAWHEEMPVQIEADPQVRIAALEAALGRAHLENEFLRRALSVLEKRGSLSEKNGR
jgi:transposase-like protein